jgi:6-phosphogluconolactonase
MKKILFILFACSACSSPTPPHAMKPDHRPIIFAGTYTEKLGHVDGKASGIYTCRFDPESGALTVVDSATDIANPSFLCISPDKKQLYAVAETGGTPDQPFGGVAAYRINENGKLLKINEVTSYGVAPCHVSTDRSGKFVFVANYVTGNVLSFGIRPDGGLTGPLDMVQHPGEQPWAHMIVPAPDNSSVWAVDKGADRIFQYLLSPDGKLKLQRSQATAKGAGPRHLDFNQMAPQQFAVINELNSTVNYYRQENDGSVTILDSVSTLPAGFSGENSCADLHFHPNGRFLYGSNRGHDSIVIFAVDAETGKLEMLGHQSTLGKFPRNFLITPDGKWLLAANQNSDTVSAFRIDAETGMLTPAGAPSPVKTPVCLRVMGSEF